MSDTSRRVLISCIVIIVVLCLCASAVAIASALGLIVTRSNGPVLQIPGFSNQGSNPVTPQPTATMTEVDIQAKMDEIQKQVIELRGLQPNGEVKRALMTPAELRQRVIDDFQKEYNPEDARDDTLALAAFGLLPADFNLHDFLVDLYSEQIAGFYDRKTKEMFVIQGESFLGPERMTYAHEYTHALQDQNFDIEKGLNYNDASCKNDTERCAAILALIEGDASLLETDWLKSDATTQERKEIMDFYGNLKSPVYDSAPDYLKADFLFPYQQGLNFVQTLHDEGGWKAVDEAYHNPPVSTEQIMHPERYPGDLPVSVSIPDVSAVLGKGWIEISDGVLGEWYTFLVLGNGNLPDTRLSERQAQNAAEGWGGDTYFVYYNETEKATTLILVTEWDKEKEANEFWRAFEQYGTARFGTPEEKSSNTITWSSANTASVFSWSGTRTIWIIAPEANTVQQLKGLIEGQ